MPTLQGEYLIYLRKSRADMEAEQRGEGETLARHEHALLELARRQQLNITDIYREVVSGETIAARPMMQKLLAEVEEGIWAGVLVMEVERLARGDTVDQGIVAQAFKFSGTKIITPTKTYDPDNEFDEEYFEFGLFMSRREYKTINRRLQRGRIASVKEGKYVGSTPPYGYDKKKIEHDKGFTLTPNAEQAPVVTMIFDLYTNGEPGPDGSVQRFGVSRIATHLDRLKIPPPKGPRWSPAHVRDMLANPVYIGKLRWNWRKDVKRRQDGQVVVTRPRASADEWLLVDGLHPPIIDKEVFDAAQDLTAQSRRIPSVHEKGVVKSPLAGLIVCGKCGYRMQRRPYIKQGRVPSLICNRSFCDNVGSDLDLVEAKLLSSLRDFLSDYQLKWRSEDRKDSSSIDVQRKAVRKLDNDIEALKKQKERLHDLLEQGVYDTDTFLERSRSIASRIKQAENNRATLSSNISELVKQELSRKDIIPKIEHLLEVYDDLPTPQAKNDILKEVLEKVVYTKQVSGRWGRPDDFQLVLYPRIPRATR